VRRVQRIQSEVRFVIKQLNRNAETSPIYSARHKEANTTLTISIVFLRTSIVHVRHTEQTFVLLTNFAKTICPILNTNF